MASLTGFGSNYESPISETRAAELLHPLPLPRIGFETTITSKPHGGSRLTLVMQNIDGTFVLVSATLGKP